MMGMIFVPEFSENALKVASGSGGYFVIILGLFAGVGAPTSGKLIDKFGAKLVLGLGFFISAVGALFLVLVTTNYPNMATVAVSLVLIGLGMGFTIGTPLNYMMLENTREEESNSALATLGLVRSVGTVIGPAIMIGFISHAGMNVQTNVMSLLPKEVHVASLPYAQEITDTVNTLKSNPNMKEKLENVNIPDLASMTTVKIDMSGNGSYKMPKDLLDLMKSSDVTTITKNSKTLTDRMFGEMSPKLIANIQDGVQKGIDGMKSGLPEMEKGYSGIDKGIEGMKTAINSQNQALRQMEGLYLTMSKMSSGKSMHGGMPSSGAMPQSVVDMMPPQMKSQMPHQVLEQLKDVKSAEDVKKKIDELKAAITELEGKITEAQNSKVGMAKAKSGMEDIIPKMVTLKEAVPSAFETAKKDYIKEIDKLSGKIESEFQNTLNKGFKQVYLTVTISSVLALLILAFYRRRKEMA
jgi:hypothetical protein